MKNPLALFFSCLLAFPFIVYFAMKKRTRANTRETMNSLLLLDGWRLHFKWNWIFNLHSKLVWLEKYRSQQYFQLWPTKLSQLLFQYTATRDFWAQTAWNFHFVVKHLLNSTLSLRLTCLCSVITRFIFLKINLWAIGNQLHTLIRYETIEGKGERRKRKIRNS